VFGPEQGKGGSFLVTRNPGPNNKPAAQAYVDHFCFSLSNWDETRVRAAVKAKGQEISGGRDGSLHVLDPYSYKHPVRQYRRRKRISALDRRGESPWKVLQHRSSTSSRPARSAAAG
jgi:hypothetical protein